MSPRLERGFDIALELRKHALGVIARLDPHQINETRLALDRRPDEYVPKSAKESLSALFRLYRIKPRHGLSYQQVLPMSRRANGGLARRR
jgi:hypothetical protein